MKKNTITRSAIFFVVTTALLATQCTNEVAAMKPGKGGGGAAYTIIPFRPPGFQSVSSQVVDLNETGQAVGFAEQSDGDDQAVHLDIATGVYTLLRNGSVATGLNRHNQIVGELHSGGLSLGTFWKNPSADPVPLRPLSGDIESRVAGINDSGIVVGSSVNENLVEMGVIWRVVIDANGDPQVDGPLVLAPVNGDTESWASDINEVADGLAEIVGTSGLNGGLREAVVWTIMLNNDGSVAAPGRPVQLGTLGTRNPSESSAKAVNNSGDVCGTSDWRPFLAPADQALQPLDAPRKAVGGVAADLNDHGQIVGMLEIGRLASDHAYLWKSGDEVDLNSQIPVDSGWSRLTWANRINNSGVIAGWGSYDVTMRGFLMIPK